MKVLLTNDDGVMSPGLGTMAKLLAYKGLLHAVIAPDRDRSGIGHAITVSAPVRLQPLEPGMFAQGVTGYSCDGTPTDCVTLGLDLMVPNADFVVSGINQGPNLGDDVTYSGTACAAMEGVILGRPAIAVSLCSKSSDTAHHNMTAAIAAMAVLEYIEKEGLPKGILLNINVPNEPIRNIKGFKLTKQGVRRYRDKFMVQKDPHGRDYYWIAGKIEDTHEEGSDVTAVADGYVSVTPIKMDMTGYELLAQMREGGVEGKLSASIKQ